MLQITKQLPSRFHHLQSLITFLGVGDQLEVQESNTFSLTIKGTFGKDLFIENNFVLKAANWIHSFYPSKTKAHITLTKNLPVSSGIGGGSSDAATTINALLDLWNVKLKDTDKKNLIIASGELGADVPVCLAHHLLKRSYFWIDGSGKEGITEFLWEEDPLANYSVLLVNPRIAVSTPEVFRIYNRVYDEAIAPPKNAEELLDFLKKTKNSLTKAATELAPEIEIVLNLLQSSDGCLLARMSGSGATCFGVYKNTHACDQVRKNLNPNWWVQ